MRSLRIVPHPEGANSAAISIRRLVMPVAGVLPTGVVLRHWEFGFKQSSFDHIARVLRGPGSDTFPSPRVDGMLVSRPPFGVG
jgi:hypothetical protein